MLESQLFLLLWLYRLLEQWDTFFHLSWPEFPILLKSVLPRNLDSVMNELLQPWNFTQFWFITWINWNSFLGTIFNPLFSSNLSKKTPKKWKKRKRIIFLCLVWGCAVKLKWKEWLGFSLYYLKLEILSFSKWGYFLLE